MSEPYSYELAYPPLKEPLSPSHLGYHSNNKYDGFPPLMSDGRTITASYQPEAILNDHLIKEIGVETNWQYRQYLMRNSEDINKYNRLQMATDSGYFKRYGDSHEVHSSPIIVRENSVKKKSESDLKQVYLSREQLQARMVAPELTQSELYLRR